MGHEEATYEAAMDLARRWHYQTVRSIANDAIEACVGKLVPADEATRMAWSDAIKAELTEDADAILEKHPTTRINRERDMGEDAREWLTEHVDGVTDDHNHVIYTGKAWMLCAASDNDDAYQEQMGEPPPTIEARACMALRADVWEMLEARSDEWDIEDTDEDDADEDDADEDDEEEEAV
jgi:hypothetical protein